MKKENTVFKDVLLPTDGSKGSDRAVEYAMDFARRDQGVLHVINVIEKTVLPPEGDVEASSRFWRNRGRKAIHNIRNRAKKEGVKTKAVLIEGERAFEGILNYIEQNEIDLVIMPTHGRSGPAEFFIGSTTERIIRTSPVPVLAIPVTGNPKESSKSPPPLLT